MNGRWPSLMNLETAAEYVSLSPRTLEEYIDEGKVPFGWARLPLAEGRYVRKRLIAKADLDRWADVELIVRKNRHGPTGTAFVKFVKRTTHFVQNYRYGDYESGQG